MQVAGRAALTPVRMRRPVLVLTRDVLAAWLHTGTVAPITSTIRRAPNGRLGPGRMFKVCRALNAAFGCEATMVREEPWSL